MMVKGWVSHSELQKEENLGLMNYLGNSYRVARLRAGDMYSSCG